MAELTIYQQTKNGVIKIYCEDCKPQGTSQRGTLVVSGFDHFCAGCGGDFVDIAERIVQKQAAWDNHQMGY